MTVCAANEVLMSASCGDGSKVLLQEAGAIGPELSDAAGQAASQLGREETPDVGCTALSPELQLALGPDPGHCWPPASCARRTGLSAPNRFAWYTTEDVVTVDVSAT